ncbi:MAG: hypothetical protein DMG70_30820 [Acidobacteria bacterium]|nr:MAG: hypothetical protein DMG70_30820 [Acidobacteriota bacterium]PYY12717.1 MAG: hypothetical protein DMG69_00315 [Acidobacteriota bacterium]
MVHKIWIPLQTDSRLQATPLQGICDRRHSRGEQYRRKKLLFYFGWGSSLQVGRSLDLTGQPVAMPGVAAAKSEMSQPPEGRKMDARARTSAACL